MTDYLINQKQVFSRYFCDFFFNLEFDSGGEFVFSFWLCRDLENVYELKNKNYNACDYNTNKNCIIRDIQKAIGFCERMGFKE